jgi:hypothetical protein
MPRMLATLRGLNIFMEKYAQPLMPISRLHNYILSFLRPIRKTVQLAKNKSAPYVGIGVRI